MNAFVGTKTVTSAEELRSLLQSFKSKDSYFFLKWPHKVSGLCKEIPDGFPSPEGQLFDAEKELRWKQDGKGYSLLLLSVKQYDGFEAMGKDWDACDQNAHLYPKTETRFPKELRYKDTNIGQRYFRNSKTATVHFVALTVS